MLHASLALLFTAAVIGAYLATRHLRGSPPPIVYAIPHGLIGLSGFILLVTDLILYERTLSKVLGAILLALGALVGLVMLFGHKHGRAIPGLMIVVHASFGVTALLLLTFAAGFWG